MKYLKFLKKFLFISLIAVLCACFFAGCGMPYGAELDSHANKYISEEFLNENRVYGAYYRNDNYDENNVDDTRYIQDKDSPKNRTYILTEETQFQEIFTKCDDAVDFDKQIVILYMFSDVYGAREYYLRKILIQDNKLVVHYILEDRGGADDASMPGVRCFMLKMENVEFNKVVFLEDRKNGFNIYEGKEE